MKSLKFFFFLFVLGFIAQSQERPPINVFYPEDYGGDSQNWSISQSSDHYLYFANNKGLLEFNGAKWSLYNSPNQTILRSVKVIDSLIYTGSYHEFGYWDKDEFGILNYTSLSTKLEINFLEDEEIWNILSLENWILFQSLNRIHIFEKSKNSYNVVNSISTISKLFKVNNNLFFQNLNNGLYQIIRGKDVLVSNDQVLKNNVIVNIFNHNDDLLIITQDNGFFSLKNGELKPWNIPANNLLKDISVFSSIQLQDRSIVLGTISDGIIHLTSSGEINYRINQSNGLSNNTVLSIFEDIDNNIWLGLDNGINSINISSPYLFYNDNSGTIGSVYTSKVYKDILYLGTNQGLFYRALNSNEKFKFIENTQGQVWSIENINNTLFCGHNSGTFVIDNNQAIKISNIPGTWQIKTIDNHDNLIIQGNYDGLHILENNNGVWNYKNKIKGFNISSRYFEFLNNKEIFINHEYKGLFRLKINDDFTKVNSFFKDSLLNKGLYTSLIKFNKDILYTSKNGVYKFNVSSNNFKKDTLLSKLITKKEFTSAKLVPDNSTNKLWSFSKPTIKYLTSSKLSGEMKIKSITFPVDIRKDIVGFENITHITDNKFLLGSSTGYTVLNLNKTLDLKHSINIDKITVSHLKNNDSIRYVNLNSKTEFKNKENNFKFTYSISGYYKTLRPEYQYKLEGIYDTWSDWSTDGTVLFENLPYGDYNFSVKGRVGNQYSSNTETYSFKIDRPWYISNSAIAVYVIFILLFLLFIHNVYKRYYRKQRERLMLKTTREFNLKALENKQQLMRFKNERLKEDIESKNRELGISTMNLIKKNEFLNTIKKELENNEGNKNLDKVIKIIDKNLNDSDDWNLFQEAFNNADKDFLKKIKSIHPNLTANDLRLCAYLRLNLSSKEIAPLLNISPRSVEVKRYRLRKKMDLAHESSLSDYILEI
ncbi:LuxR C-terminal-related transcriptional regulator [uncultured Algibacter sp.]|uniref:helix-turn-helix and ligand-binding sensor domain-containing protein n=1 Tax=uncultured Algibacter sp. TaxID=298659 RepID=UPI0026357223|nr:LuxR C-terminal-related transcriptional regulator [uncultured Algibacter sp.]